MRSRLEPMKKVARMLRAHEPLILNVGGGEKGYQNGGEVVPCQGSRSE
jgi:hypothetical protein